MKRLFSVVLALLLAVQLPARVKLPAVLGSNMVLQLGRSIATQPGAGHRLMGRPHA